jgi:predicted RNase H-like HicB family nuclease
MKLKLKLTAVFQEAEEGGNIGFVERLPGVNTQGDSPEETKTNLLEALDMVLAAQRELSEVGLGNKKVIRESLELV